MNNILQFVEKVIKNPSSITFTETIAIIDSNYNFIPTAFKNGNHFNNVNENNGSCKIFAFAKINNLDKEVTLTLFGSYYFDDVLKNPNGSDHQNIRNFMFFGWDEIVFNGEALVLK